MHYVQVQNGVIVNRAVFADDVPMPGDWPDHADWYQNEDAQIGWTYTGGVFAAPVEPPVPVTLPDLLPYQFRAVLVLSGKADALNAYIAALLDPQKTVSQAKLDYSLSFERKNSLVLAAQGALGLTDDQLDALWAQGAAIS